MSTPSTPPAEVQPVPAIATVDISRPYCYRIDRPAPHRPEGEFTMSWGTWAQAPAPLLSCGRVEHVATYEAARARMEHLYWGPMTIRIWQRRAEESYRDDPPADAYRLDVGDQADTINPNTKALVEQLHRDERT